MKKVGKEFRKSLSAILAAAMVVSGMPNTTLVANAEEETETVSVEETAESEETTDEASDTPVEEEEPVVEEVEEEIVEENEDDIEANGLGEEENEEEISVLSLVYENVSFSFTGNASTDDLSAGVDIKYQLKNGNTNVGSLTVLDENTGLLDAADAAGQGANSFDNIDFTIVGTENKYEVYINGNKLTSTPTNIVVSGDTNIEVDIEAKKWEVENTSGKTIEYKIFDSSKTDVNIMADTSDFITLEAGETIDVFNTDLVVVKVENGATAPKADSNSIAVTQVTEATPDNFYDYYKFAASKDFAISEVKEAATKKITEVTNVDKVAVQYAVANANVSSLTTPQQLNDIEFTSSIASIKPRANQFIIVKINDDEDAVVKFKDTTTASAFEDEQGTHATGVYTKDINTNAAGYTFYSYKVSTSDVSFEIAKNEHSLIIPTADLSAYDVAITYTNAPATTTSSSNTLYGGIKKNTVVTVKVADKAAATNKITEVKLVGAGGAEILTADGAGTYTFKMPAENVTLTLTPTGYVQVGTLQENLDGAGEAALSNVTIAYSDKVDGTYKNLTATTNLLASTKYYFKVTSNSKAIAGVAVTGLTGLKEVGNGIYEATTIASGTAMSITVSTTSLTQSSKFTVNAPNCKVYYQYATDVDGGTASLSAEKMISDGENTVPVVKGVVNADPAQTTKTKVVIKIVPDDGYEIAANGFTVKDGTTTLSNDGASSRPSAIAKAANGSLTITDYDGTGLTISAEATKQKDVFTFDATDTSSAAGADHSGVTYYITTPTNTYTVRSGEKEDITVEDGDEVQFTVTADDPVYKVANTSVKMGGTYAFGDSSNLPNTSYSIVDGEYIYKFKADVAATDKAAAGTITAEASARTATKLTFDTTAATNIITKSVYTDTNGVISTTPDSTTPWQAISGQQIKIELTDGTVSPAVPTYIVDKLLYEDKDGIMQEVSGDGTTYILDLDADMISKSVAAGDTLKFTVIEKINPEKAKTTTFVYDDTIVRILDANGGNDVKASNNTVISTGAINPEVELLKDGYEIDKILVNGDEITVSNKTPKSGSALTVPVSFATDVTDVTVEVIVKAAKNEKDRTIIIDNTDKDLISYNVQTGDGIEYDEYRKEYYIDKEVDTVTLTASVPYGYEIILAAASDDATAGPGGNGNVTSAIREVSVDKTPYGRTTYTWEVATSALGIVTSGGDIAVNTITLSAGDDDVYYGFGTDLGGGIFGLARASAENGRRGSETHFYYKQKDKETLWRTEAVLDGSSRLVPKTDENGNENWTQVAFDSYGEYECDIHDDYTLFDVRYESDPAEYQITATKNGYTLDYDKVTDTTTEISAKAGDVIVLTATDRPSTDMFIEKIAELPYKSKITELDAAGAGKTGYKTIKIEISKEDAGQTITIPLKTNKGSDTAPQIVDLATVNITVSPEATGMTLKDEDENVIANGTTLDLEIGQSVEYSVAPVPASVDPSLYKMVTKSSNFKFEDGKLTYTATKEETAEVTFVDSATGKIELFKLTINAKAPTLKLFNFVSPSQSTTYVNVKAEASGDVKATDNLYYEIVSVPADGADKPSLAVKKVLYVKATDVDEDGKLIVVPMAQKMTVANSPADNAKDEVWDKLPWTYNVTARLVVTKEAAPEGFQSTELASTKILSAGEASKLTLTTKARYVEDNLKLTKVTSSVLTRVDTVVAKLKFSENASVVDNATVKGLNENGTLNGQISGYVDSTTGEVHVWVDGNVKPGKYKIEVAAGTEGSVVKATASMGINVKAGINYIDESGITGKITKNPSKNVTITLKPVAYTGFVDDDGNHTVKAKSQKFIYEIVDRNGNKIDPKTKDTKLLNILNNVSLKGSKLTVSKDFTITPNTSNNVFGLKISAADSEDNTFSTVKYITVTSEYAEPAKIVLMKGGKVLGDTSDFAQADGARIVVQDAKGNALDCVKVTTSTEGAAIKDGALNITGKPKSVTINATTTDGGKKKAPKLKIKLGYAASKGFNVQLVNADNFQLVGTDKYEYIATDKTTPVYFQVYNGNVSNGDLAKPAYFNYKVDVKGATKVTDKNYTKDYAGYIIMPNAKETVITITDKSVKPNVKKEIVLTNNAFVQDKAPKAKLTKGNVLYANVYNAQTLNYTVDTTYDAVQVIDVTAPKENFGAALSSDVISVHDGRFALDFDWTDKKTGTLKYNLIYGYMDDDQIFRPCTDAAKLNVKLSKLKKFKADLNYVVNYADSTIVEFTGAPDEAFEGIVNVSNVNVGGKGNKFTDYFEKADWKHINFKFQPDSKNKIEDIKADDLKGYVTYRYMSNKGIVEKTELVTMSLSSDNKAYGCDFAPVMKASSISTKGVVTLDDETITLKSVKSATKGWTATLEADGETIKLTSSAATIGVNEVELLMIPQESMYERSALDKNGVKTTVSVNVLDPEVATDKIEVNSKLTMIDLDGEGSVQGYVNKVGTYTSAPIQLSGDVDPDKNVVNSVVSNLTVTTAKLAEGAPEGFKVTYSGGILKITASADKMTPSSVVKVPVSVGFNNSKVEEVVEFSVVTPAIKDINDVAADVAKYLSTECYESANAATGAIDSDLDAQKAIDTVLDKDAAAGVSIKTSTAKYTASNSTAGTGATVSVTLVSQADREVEVEVTAVELAKKAPIRVQKTKTDVYDEMINQAANILDEGTVAAEKEAGRTTYDNLDEGIDYMEVSAATTRFEVRSFLQQYINNSEYLLRIEDFEVVAANTRRDGHVQFKVTIVSAKDSTNVSDTFTVTAKLNKIVPETPAN